MKINGRRTQKHFLMVGHGGFLNRGCEAILDTTFRLLSEYFQKSTFTVVSFDWANDRQYAEEWAHINFRNVIPERWRSPHWYLRNARRLLRIPSRDWRAIHKHLRPEYKKADAVLSVGGDNYTSDYGALPGYYLDLLRYARQQDRKAVIWAASVGPFHDPEVQSKVLEVLEDTPLITARESLTVEYLASLGLEENVRAVADPAFLLHPQASPLGLSHGVGEEGDWLGVCVSSMLWRFASDGESRDRSDVLVKFIDWAIREFNLHVALIPHVIDTRPGAPLGRRDHVFLGQIAERISERNRAILVNPSLHVRELKYMISRCRFFVGSRTHSTISALSSGVPTISVSYSMKSRGINRDVLGSEDFVLPVDDISFERLATVFRDLVNREAEIRAALRERIPVIKEMARKNAHYLAELISPEGLGKHDEKLDN